MKTKRLPRGFRKGHDGSLACPHRDLSCCNDCAKAHKEIVDVLGAHFWVTDPAERNKLLSEIADEPTSDLDYAVGAAIVQLEDLEPAERIEAALRVLAEVAGVDVEKVREVLR